MRKSFFTILLLVSYYSLIAQSPNKIRAYIEQYKFKALEQEKLYGIPAPITLAQGILESEAGQSGLAKNANNHFGIKALGNWDGGVYQAWDDEPTKSKFRVYASAEESFTDHSQLIKNNSRYQSLFNFSIFDYRSWANGLQKAGYATAPNYAKAIIGYIDAYQLYTINGGVKLKPGKKSVIKKTVTVEELIENDEVLEDTQISEEEESLLHFFQMIVVAVNGVRCTILYPGETLSSVAMKYDISKQKLFEYNELEDESELQEGDIIYLQKKKRKYQGAQDYYRVQDNESLLSISQQFGITVSSLAKLNHKDPVAKLKEGEMLRLK